MVALVGLPCPSSFCSDVIPVNQLDQQLLDYTHKQNWVQSID